MRESEIHFSRWIFDRKEKNWLNIILLSLAFHAIIFVLLYYSKPKAEIVADQGASSIKINFSKLHQDQKITKKIIVKQEHKILTDTNPNSQSKFFSPKHSVPKVIPKEKETSEADDSINSFLPNSSTNYVDNLRHQNQLPKNEIEGDDGDIPIEGPSLAPTNEPRVVKRFAEKDMSLFQFTQEFRERFGAVWNSEDRVVPPSSPLHPGDIVYYKVYINTNGSMEKFENLSRTSHPQKDYTAIDKIFSNVVANVFPMVVPPKFAHKNITLTEVIAIQVVDRNMPARYSF